MRVWLAKDDYPNPELGPTFLHRISMQDEPFTRAHFPAGKRGKFFKTRVADVNEATWDALMAGTLTPEEQNKFHRDAWNQSARSDKEKWPG